MVQGYEYHHLLRTTPKNGFAQTFDFRELFPDAERPVRTDVGWDEIREDREDINYNDRTVFRGYRLNCRLAIAILTTDHQRYFVEIDHRLKSSAWDCELSFDAGARWYRVRGVGDYRPEPLGGKNFAGAMYQLGLRGIVPERRAPELAGALGLEVYTDPVGTDLPDPALWKGAMFTVKKPGRPSATYISVSSGLGVWRWDLPPVREGEFA